MLKLADFKGFIFDLDGLVLDTEPTYFAAWQQAIVEMGYQIELEFIYCLSGCSYDQVETQLQVWLGQDFDLVFFKQLSTECWWNYIHQYGIVVKKGVISLLDFAQAHAIPICIGTNSSYIYAQKCLTIAGLNQRYPLMVTSDDVQHVKPAPDIFLRAAERMAVDIKHCVIFEDSYVGIAAASASGAKTVCVPSTFPLNPKILELSDYVFDDLTQVLESLAA